MYWRIAPVGVLPLGLGVNAHAVIGRNSRGVLADQLDVGPQALAVARQADDVTAVMLAVHLEVGSGWNGDRDLPLLELLERIGPMLQCGRCDLEGFAVGSQVIATTNRFHAKFVNRLAVDKTHGLQLVATGRYRLSDIVEGQTESACETCNHDGCILGQAPNLRQRHRRDNAFQCCRMMRCARAGCGPIRRATRKSLGGSIGFVDGWGLRLLTSRS